MMLLRIGFIPESGLPAANDDHFDLVSPSTSQYGPTGSGNSISYQTYSVRLPVYVLDQLREIAELDSCPVSHVVRLAVRRYLFGSGCSHES